MTRLIGIYGKVGSGKTLFATRMCLKSTVPFVANYQIFKDKEKEILDKRYNPLEVEELISLKINPAKVVIDEAYAWLECRIANSNINRYMSYILFQSRKRGLDFIITAQLEDTIDNRFTKLCDYIVMAEQIRDGFLYWISDRRHIRTFKISFKMAEFIWDRYKTEELIMPPQIENLRTQVEVLDRSKLKAKLDILEENYLSEYGSKYKITHALVDNFLLDANESDVYSSYLYARLLKAMQEKQEPHQKK